MANRIRNERLEIKLTEEEKALFEEKKRLAKCRNMSHFIRKCVLEKEIYQVDLEPFRDLQGLLSNATNNINQIAKRVNSTSCRSILFSLPKLFSVFPFCIDNEFD